MVTAARMWPVSIEIGFMELINSLICSRWIGAKNESQILYFITCCYWQYHVWGWNPDDKTSVQSVHMPGPADSCANWPCNKHILIRCGNAKLNMECCAWIFSSLWFAKRTTCILWYNLIYRPILKSLILIKFHVPNIWGLPQRDLTSLPEWSCFWFIQVA